MMLGPTQDSASSNDSYYTSIISLLLKTVNSKWIVKWICVQHPLVSILNQSSYAVFLFSNIIIV